MSEKVEKIAYRELFSDFFCWLFFPILGITLFILSGFLVQPYSLLLYYGWSLQHHFILLFLLATPTGIGLLMFSRTVISEKSGETHVLVIILGQILLIVGAIYPFGAYVVIGAPISWMLPVGSLINISSLITNFIGLLGWLNIWYMRSRQ